MTAVGEQSAVSDIVEKWYRFIFPLPKKEPIPLSRVQMRPLQGEQTVWRFLVFPFGCIALMAIGAFVGWFLSGVFNERAHDRTIAMSWGDGKYGKNFYGAHVYLVPEGDEYSVRARVLIGPGNNYYDDFQEIGRAKSVQEAIDRFGKIQWDEQGLKIGDPEKGGFYRPRVRLESHR